MNFFFNLGITYKLLLSFALVVGSTLLATGIAVNSYSIISNSLQNITERSVPLMSNSMVSAQLAIELSAAVTVLTSSEDQSSRISNFENISALAQRLEERFSDKGDVVATPAESSMVQASMATLKDKIHSIDNSLESRINASETTKERMRAINSIQQTVSADLLLIVEKSTASFEALAGNKFDENSELIDSLFGTRVAQLISSYKLQNSISAISALLSSTSISDSIYSDNNAKQALEFNSKLIAEHRSNISLEHIDDLAQLDQDIATLIGMATTRIETIDTNLARSLFLTPVSGLQALKSNAHVLNLRVRIIEALSFTIEAGNFLIALDSDELALIANESLPEILAEGVTQLTALLKLRAELNTIAGALGQALIVTDLNNLDPLKMQYQKSQNTIRNIIPKTSTIQGMYEISDQIEKLFTLGDDLSGVFFHRSQELVSNREIADTRQAVELAETTIVSSLVDLVVESREQVAVESKSANLQLQNSKSQLIIVSVASLLTTVLVFWLVVSRSLLKRLHQTITALRSLSKGNYDVSVTIRGNDELTDLARTVEVFQKTAIESQALYAEKEQQSQIQREQEKQQIQYDLETNARKEQARIREQEHTQASKQREESLELQERVDQLLLAVNAAANGDLNHPIDTSNNDLSGQMGRALNSLFSEMRSSMYSIDENSVQLNNASDRLIALSSDMNELSTANADNSANASILSDDVDTGINTVAGASDRLTISINNIVHNTAEAESVAQEAVKLAQATDATVRKLADSSVGISSVIKVINTIAEQTNLLALNATIEAARAGDAGKGFAVVADEVKQLAKGTAGATEQIEARILDIQTDTESAVTAIHSISKIVTRISEIQSSISIAVEDQAQITHDISHSVAKTSGSSEAIATLIKDVASRAKTGLDTSTDVKLAASELSEVATQLQQLVSRFRKDAQGSTTLRKAA